MTVSLERDEKNWLWGRSRGRFKRLTAKDTAKFITVDEMENPEILWSGDSNVTRLILLSIRLTANNCA
jgi:hypothetical protein